MPTIALDIGGANLKASDGGARSVSRPFAIWKEPGRLAEELRELLVGFRGQESGVRGQGEPAERGRGSVEGTDVRSDVVETTTSLKPPAANPTSLAVTMTAELADCFVTKAEGVNFILDAVLDVAGECEVLVWQTGGEFVAPDEARELVPLVAAANWHALATWAARMTLGTDASSALLIDLGSTTCDIIPLVDGLPMPTGLTDVERLMSSELVYTGVRRTPLMAVCPSVPFREVNVPLAAELFATTLDVYLLTGDIAEDVTDTNTANGRPATVDAAWDRIARSLCCDRNECTLDEAREIAGHLRAAHHSQIASAIEHVASTLGSPLQLVLSGEGEPMLRSIVASLVERNALSIRDDGILSLNKLLGPTHSSCACAYALARLADERNS